jgi:hypothetical protein
VVARFIRTTCHALIDLLASISDRLVDARLEGRGLALHDGIDLGAHLCFRPGDFLAGDALDVVGDSAIEVSWRQVRGGFSLTRGR